MSKTILSGVLVGAVLWAAYALLLSRHSEFNRAGLVGTSGRIDSGEKFGVSIGDDYRHIQERFQRIGFEKTELTKAQSCHGFDYPQHQRPELWFDKSWKKGTLCLVTSRDKVTYLSWSYGMGYP